MPYLCTSYDVCHPIFYIFLYKILRCVKIRHKAIKSTYQAASIIIVIGNLSTPLAKTFAHLRCFLYADMSRYLTLSRCLELVSALRNAVKILRHPAPFWNIHFSDPSTV